ncbi:hypothetical protein [Staphylococcus simulans]|uniref:hypothetical protein n=1 Tax=Staphylococcus simulans TaxID=1286 RepID=UPI0021D25E85|nr:hypothetical protein [Staphylococcus simulans]UXR30471.1 hypothetical protein MUA73_00905 [Staphylococcus simulans]UXR50135.1 hypothetical protein MUA28_00660 [Staphylococcus simulans]
MNFKKVAFSLSALTVLFSVTSQTYVDAVEQISSENESSSLYTNEELDMEGLTRTLSAIEHMPDSVINEGKPAIENYLNEQGIGVQTYGASVSNYAACTGAIGYALVTNFTPAKIAKVKSALKAAGGTLTFVKKMSGAYKQLRKLGHSKQSAVKNAAAQAAKAAGPDVKEALLDFFGIATIVGACAPIFEK